MIDIVGSPYHMALDEVGYQHWGKFPDEVETQIARSFQVDSIVNVIAPMVGAPPVVYYAENLAGKALEGRGPAVAYIPAALFLALGIAGYVLAQHGTSIGFLIPGIAVAPALFAIGLIIISKAFASGETRLIPEKREEQNGATTARDGWQQEFLDFAFLLFPSAIAVVITPAWGFDVGVAAGIVSYTMFHLIVPREPTKQYEGNVSHLLMWSAF